MNVFHLEEFGKLKDVHHTMETCSGFKWATALNSEHADSVITHTCMCVLLLICLLCKGKKLLKYTLRFTHEIHL